jgi:ribosomal peptide maturation radical SAM protein 1
MVDNVPAPHYFSTFLPQLAKGRDAYELFYETRCHLKRDQVKMLADAGVVSIQPGIEALDNRQLALMNKGTTTLMNLQMLKYAREFSLQASWRLIVGLPGEKDDWHLETASWFPLVHHLQPPMGVDQVRMLRFSSYHSNAEAYGLDLVPNANYTKNYPLSEDVLSNLVYYFQRTDVKQHSKVFSPGVEALSKGVKDWQQAAFPPVPAFLCMQDDGDTISILDTRACAMERQFKIDGMAADILRSCDPALERSQLLERMTPSSTTMNRDDILDTVEMLKAKKLLLEIDQYLLSLPTQGWFPDPKIPGNRSPIGFSPDPKPEDFLS